MNQSKTMAGTNEGYSWPERCCMSSLAELTEALGGDSTDMRAEMELSENESLRKNLARHKTLAAAYDDMLTRNGYVKATNGFVAVIDGNIIRTANGGVFYPRGKLQIMAFRRLNGWAAWTDGGLALVYEYTQGDDVLRIQPYQWALKTRRTNNGHEENNSG